MAITDSSLMPFGKYMGKRLIDILAKYFIWLFDEGCNHPGVKAYILENLEALKKEAGQTKRK